MKRNSLTTIRTWVKLSRNSAESSIKNYPPDRLKNSEIITGKTTGQVKKSEVFTRQVKKTKIFNELVRKIKIVTGQNNWISQKIKNIHRTDKKNQQLSPDRSRGKVSADS